MSSADYYLGDYHASIAAAKQALALYKSTGDLYWQGIVLGNLADTYQEVGDPSGSLAAGDAALRIAQSIGDPSSVWKALPFPFT